jgi:ATP-binding cassette, subfamily B, multidrug efflux pump
MQNKKKASWVSLARLLRFLWQDYKLSLSISFVLIVVASLATVNLTASIQSLVDVYVQPMLKSGSHDFGPLLRFLTSVANVVGPMSQGDNVNVFVSHVPSS